jgi:hypothetical protein
VAVKIDGDNVWVGYKLDPLNDVFWLFRQEGVNDQFATTKAYKFSNATSKPVTTHDFASATAWIGDIDTDWVGPYQVNLSGGSYPSTFSGGHHDKSGGTSPSGTPSARSSGRKIFLDGSTQEVTADGSYYCKFVQMTTTNFVQGDVNTDDTEILQQDCNFIVNNIGIRVKITSTALTNILVGKFYGIQTRAPSTGYSSIRFVGDSSTSGLVSASATGNIFSSKEKIDKCNMIAHLRSDGYTLNSFLIDTSLGGFRYKGSANGYCNRSNGKTYFYCNGIGFNAVSGEQFIVEGGWSVHKRATLSGNGQPGTGLFYAPAPQGATLIADFFGESLASRVTLYDMPLKNMVSMRIDGLANVYDDQTSIDGWYTGESDGVTLGKIKRMHLIDTSRMLGL